MKILNLSLILAILFGCQSNKKTNDEKSYKLMIAYNVLFDSETDNYEIISMDFDGGNKKNITNLDGVEWTYYAENDNLYFVSDKNVDSRHYYIYSMKADGSEMEKISPIRLRDSWFGSRKNGSEFIINPHKTVDSAFLIINSSGDILSRIRPGLKYFSDPSFSPDGTQIAFRGAHFTSKRESGFVDEIYVMNADGSNMTQLTNYPENDTTAMWYAYKAGPPKWHPTDNFISYSSYQNGIYSLFGISLDGQKQWQITGPEQCAVYHDWSPDGQWLVTDLSDNDNPPFHIGLINYESGATTILTDTTYQFHQSPVFVKAYE